MLNKSIIIAAHLDDEALWFSSILDKVDDIIICFLNYKQIPDLGVGRKKSILEYPLKNIACLEIDESGVYGCADWDNPVLSKYGIELSNKNISDKKYKKNYSKLLKKLKVKVAGYDNVFTHNPWGEYGNEDHIQIYRVVKQLQEQLKFNLWFPNYCSNQSNNLMIKYIYNNNFEYVTMETNINLGQNIKNILLRNRCWTWYDDWKWFDTESFIKEKKIKEEIRFGRLFPVNFIKVQYGN